MNLHAQHLKMAQYFALLPEKHIITLDDIDQLYPMRLNQTDIDTIWYDWSKSGKLILHNDRCALRPELTITVDDSIAGKCYIKDRPLIAVTLQRLSKPTMQATSDNGGDK